MPWKPVLITLVIGWFLGMATGFVVTRCVPPLGAWPHPHAGRKRFYKALALTPAQREQVDAIITKNHERLAEIFSEMNPRVEEVRTTTRDEIRKLLTPEQQAKFDKRDAEFAKRFKKRFEPLAPEKPHE